jgi:hypothetical protein
MYQKGLIVANQGRVNGRNSPSQMRAEIDV